MDYVAIAKAALTSAASVRKDSGGVQDVPLQIKVESDMDELDRAFDVVHSAGLRLMEIDGVFTVGVWSDLDSAEFRAALKVFGSDEAPVRYLDGPGIPVRYAARRVPGQPVPPNVRAAMECAASDPWNTRDAMLRGRR